MSATTQLSQHLAHLSDSLKTTNNLITQLSKLSFQPGSEPLDNSDQSTVRIELSQDIHDSLKQLEEDLELLKQEAEDLNASASAGHRRRDSDRDREKARLTAQVARLTEDLKTSRSHFRRAQLTAKKASEAAKQKERELVFASLQNPPASESLPNGTSPESADLFAGRRLLAQKSKLTKEELELDASSNVTASLRRTHDLLSTELSRSRFAQETFDQSTAALAELGEHYSNLDTILSNSRNLLGTLLRSQKSDTWYLETAFYILVVTLCWLVFRRILLGPFVRLPLFLFRWFLWKPFVLFLSVTGVLNTNPSAAAGGRNEVAGPRTPLIVQSSARASATPLGGQMASGGRGVPVGAGGAGAKVKPAGEMVENIGRMAEDSEKANEGHGEPQRRADGTVLEERGDEKPNPKKRMFEADVEDQRQAEREKQEQGRDEL